MTVAVTGGRGFVGANVVRELALRGYTVLCVSRSGSVKEQNLERFFSPFSDKITYIKADITNYDSVTEVFARFEPDCVVHAAAITPTLELEMSSPRTVLETNAVGTLNVLEAARQTRTVKRILHLSSGAVYGGTVEGTVVTEEMPTTPRDLYGLTKEIGERLCTYYRDTHHLDVVIARVGSVYGPMERPLAASRQRMSLVYCLVELAGRGEEIRVVDLGHVRDWIHAADVAKASILLLELPNLKHHIYNLSAGCGYTHHQLIEELNRIIPLRYRRATEGEANVPAAVTVGRRGPMSIERLATDTGFALTYPLSEGLRQYVQWVRDGISLEDEERTKST